MLQDRAREEELRRRAARTVRRLVGVALAGDLAGEEGAAPAPGAPLAAAEDEAPDHGFVVTDGHCSWTATLIELPARPARLVMFSGALPPAGAELWVVSRTVDRLPAPRALPEAEVEGGVICFTPGTLISTPSGPRPVEAIRPGDPVLTRDDGAQPVLWTGCRRMSGARLYAMPHLRPVRIRAGAMGEDRPERDLLVSPRHRMLLRGDAARALFNTPEVLAAAGDLVDGRGIAVDHALREVTYVHLLLDRHQIVWANGLETESFHPASAALDMILPEQRAGLAAALPGVLEDPLGYGDFARRLLTAPEAAILRHEAA